MRTLPATAALAAILILASPRAEARCPSDGWPTSDACKNLEAFFMPGLIGLVYAPSDAGGTWVGGGVEIAPFVWSHNTEKFGPGQGRLVFDIGLLDAPDASGSMLLYRGGVQLSFERNASRTLGIPFFGVMTGGLAHEQLDDVGFFEATVGVHVLFYKNVTVTIDGGYLFPFADVDHLAGWRSTLAATFTMW